MKKLIWTALVALTTSTAVALTVRALRYGWKRTLHEDPPGRPWLARKLVASPLGSAVRKRVEPHAPA
jgi:hypothetical protein